MKKVTVIVAVFAWVVALGAMGMASAATAHCAGHNDASFDKLEGQGTFTIHGVVVTVDGDTVSFEDELGNPVEVVFCVKAGTGESGELTGSSFSVSWLNGGGQTPDISYVVVYELFCDPYSCGGGSDPSSEEIFPE
jgi:hypothetical protein